MEVRDQPRTLLASVDGLRLSEMRDSGTCCGFGGTFCVKYPEISTRLVDEKCANVRETGAEVLLGGDLGCLLNIAGRLTRQSHPVRVFHVAEVLAGTAARGIGEAGVMRSAAHGSPAPRPHCTAGRCTRTAERRA